MTTTVLKIIKKHFFFFMFSVNKTKLNLLCDSFIVVFFGLASSVSMKRPLQSMTVQGKESHDPQKLP